MRIMNREDFDRLVPVLKRVPEGMRYQIGTAQFHLNIPFDSDFCIYTESFSDVKILQKVFPGVWKKVWSQGLREWIFWVEFDGFIIRVFGVETIPLAKPIYAKERVIVGYEEPDDFGIETVQGH